MSAPRHHLQLPACAAQRHLYHKRAPPSKLDFWTSGELRRGTEISPAAGVTSSARRPRTKFSFLNFPQATKLQRVSYDFSPPRPRVDDSMYSLTASKFPPRAQSYITTRPPCMFQFLYAILTVTAGFLQKKDLKVYREQLFFKFKLR
ncbi:hypothetical protein C8R43DRAFT_1102582 [Mycena crocata]|nr:hypothetical protein C8R43DRAFT_1102579 [Mycena crocata]KAJ7174087.1 hypothetical protein C8R43DRAFT_1102582 [Mycena crocata]